MRPMIEAGKIYIALPPLYRLQTGRGAKTKITYAWTNDELTKLTKKAGKGAQLQRFKGLGEMNADQLWETTMNPETRTLIQVRIEDAELAERRVTTLMGNKVEPRREWIEDNVQFTMSDDKESDELVENKGHLPGQKKNEVKVGKTFNQQELF